ncbi:D-serine ammonia-lyase [Oenococcus sicerae]|uniref:Probable D-serine dehydratase n=1 Tax=Oenococcus sicerae TaxID=2203724 RepID=A0ABX5QMX4_9LACO|nr:D-serine ammonia-lyase [Oenococcus sicerae]QAS70096.1 D-serine ammonia-lyase [Oenococcus sicerae]
MANISGKKSTEYTSTLLDQLKDYQETFWKNPNYNTVLPTLSVDRNVIFQANRRLERFAPYLEDAFPDTKKSKGIIESPIQEMNEIRHFLSIDGCVLIKRDDLMPVSGSIKSRGGIYEVLCFAEDLAVKNGFNSESDDYSDLANEKFRRIFSQWQIEVASTGNLGLSVGLMASTLGFKARIHMSHDATTWKINKLRQNGVDVKIYDDNFSNAVAAARESSKQNPYSYFVDDEGSKLLFAGYATAGERVKKQLSDMHIEVSKNKPLVVYLPAGVGGSPSGVAFGLKLQFGDAVIPIFVEPTHVPSVLLGMATGLDHDISVYDLGLDGKTAADGLAVGRPSMIAGRYMKNKLFGIATVSDQNMFAYQGMLKKLENIEAEPSAVVGIRGLIQSKEIAEIPDTATHLIWSTGGSMVPAETMREYEDHAITIFNQTHFE